MDGLPQRLILITKIKAFLVGKMKILKTSRVGRGLLVIGLLSNFTYDENYTIYIKTAIKKIKTNKNRV